MKATTSSLSNRPPGPVAGTLLALRPCSSSKRFAAGITNPDPLARAGAAAGDAAGVGDGTLEGALAAVVGAGEAAEPPAGSALGMIDAITSPTTANSSCCLRIPCRIPDAGAGICTDAFSVSISTRSSPDLTQSPSDFSHWPIWTSLMDSPTVGTATWIASLTRTVLLEKGGEEATGTRLALCPEYQSASEMSGTDHYFRMVRFAAPWP